MSNHSSLSKGNSQFLNFERTVSLFGKYSHLREIARTEHKLRKTAETPPLWVRVLSIAPSGCTRFDYVYNFRQTSRSLAPTPPSLVSYLVTRRVQTVVRNRAAIIRKAELTGDAGG